MAYKDKEQMIKSVNDYNKKTYDRVTVLLPKGDRDKLRKYARTHGESMNAYLLRLIQEDIAKEEQA